MKKSTLIGIIGSVAILGGTVLPVEAQKTILHHQNSNLVSAIKSTILKDFPGENDWSDITYNVAEVDLDNDGIKEVLVGIQHGSPCNNRHCPVYIYQRHSNNYSLISYVFTSRDELDVAILSNRSQGWNNIATRVFTYQPREIAWRVFKFDGKNYQLSSKKLSVAPKRFILHRALQAEFSLGS